MESLDLLTLIDRLSQFKNGNASFKKHLIYFTEPIKVAFWQYIVDSQGEYTDSETDRIQAYAVIFNKEPYESHVMQQLSSALSQILYYYIVGKECDLSGFSAITMLKLHNEYPIISSITNAKNQGFKIAKKQDYPLRAMQEMLTQEDKKAFGLRPKSKDVYDIFHTSNKLKTLINDLTICRGREQEISKELEKEINDAFHVYEDTRLIDVMLNAIVYYQSLEEEDYWNFNDAYFEHFKYLSHFRGFLLISLVNGLIVFPKPYETMNIEYLELYHFGIEQELLVENGEISCLQYNNIIYIAEAQSDYELIRLANEKLLPFIADKKEREDSSLLSKAYILFGEGKYAEALEILKKLEDENNLRTEIKKGIHILRTKCVYEQFRDKQATYVELIKATNSIRKIVNPLEEKGEITKKSKQGLLNYCAMLCRIANQQNPSTKEELYAVFDNYNGLIVQTRFIISKIEEK